MEGYSQYFLSIIFRRLIMNFFLFFSGLCPHIFRRSERVAPPPSFFPLFFRYFYSFWASFICPWSPGYHALGSNSSFFSSFSSWRHNVVFLLSCWLLFGCQGVDLGTSIYSIFFNNLNHLIQGFWIWDPGTGYFLYL